MKHTTYKVLSICLALVVFALGAGAYFLYVSSNTRGVHIAELAASHVTEIQKQINREERAAHFAAAQSSITDIQSHILSADGEVAFINDLETAAKGYNLVVMINSVGLGGADDMSAAGLESLDVKVTVTGAWSDIYRFISYVETSSYALNITGADLNDTSDKATKGQVVWQGVFDIAVVKEKAL